MRLLMLFALIAAGAWFGPQFAEDAEGPCPALERRVAELVKSEAVKLPAGVAGDGRIAGLLSALQGMANTSGGAIAQAYVRDRFPQLPPELACVAAWWKLKFDPDLGPYIQGLLKR